MVIGVPWEGAYLEPCDNTHPGSQCYWITNNPVCIF